MMASANDSSGRCPICGACSGTVRLGLEWPDVDEWPPGTISEWGFCTTHRLRWRDFVVVAFSCVSSSFLAEIREANDEAVAETLDLEDFDEVELPEIEAVAE
jgi:hypothetical protein